jgi:hypothetical protein
VAAAGEQAQAAFGIGPNFGFGQDAGAGGDHRVGGEGVAFGLGGGEFFGGQAQRVRPGLFALAGGLVDVGVEDFRGL